MALPISHRDRSLLRHRRPRSSFLPTLRGARGSARAEGPLEATSRQSGPVREGVGVRWSLTGGRAFLSRAAWLHRHPPWLQLVLILAVWGR